MYFFDPFVDEWAVAYDHKGEMFGIPWFGRSSPNMVRRVLSSSCLPPSPTKE